MEKQAAMRLQSWWFRPLTASGALFLALGLGACAPHEDRAPLLPGGRVELTRIADPDGEGPLAIEAFRGYILLLDFWAPWSKPSRASLPALRSMQEELADGSFSIIGMTVLKEVTPELRAEIEALALPYPVVLHEETVSRRMGTGRAIPTRVLLGRDGAVLRIYRGWVDLDRLRNDVEHALRGDVLPPEPQF